MKKYLISIGLVALLTLSGCAAFKDYKAGLAYCKANPVTCNEPAKAEGKAIGAKVTAVITPVIQTAATPIAGAPLANAAGSATGMLGGLLVGWIAAEIKAAIKGKANKAAGIADSTVTIAPAA